MTVAVALRRIAVIRSLPADVPGAGDLRRSMAAAATRAAAVLPYGSLDADDQGRLVLRAASEISSGWLSSPVKRSPSMFWEYFIVTL